MEKKEKKAISLLPQWFEKKFEIFENEKVLRVNYSFTDDETWDLITGSISYKILIDNMPALERYLKNSIDDEGTSYIFGNIKKELIPAGILLKIPTAKEHRESALAEMIW